MRENSYTTYISTFRCNEFIDIGCDISTIAIWLGHSSIETTHKYMIADMELKRKAMEKWEVPVTVLINTSHLQIS